MLGMVLGDESLDHPYLSVWPPLSMTRVALTGDATDDGLIDAFTDDVCFRFFSGGIEGTCDGTGGGWGGSMIL